MMSARAGTIALGTAALGMLAGFAGVRVAAARHRPSMLPYYDTPDLTPRWAVSEPTRGGTVHRIADWTLTDQTGHRLSASDLDGKIYVAAFFFTRCGGFCPMLRSNLATVADAFRGDTSVMILSHTVTPAIDDTAKLAAYAATNRIHVPQWRLLTGPAEAIAMLARRSYFVALADSARGATPGTLVHTETVLLVDGQRRIRGVYDGTLAFDVDRMIDDIRVLRKEQSRGE